MGDVRDGSGLVNQAMHDVPVDASNGTGHMARRRGMMNFGDRRDETTRNLHGAAAQPYLE